MSTLNKIIMFTAIQGLIWTAAVFSYGLGIFAKAFPEQMASFYDTVGNPQLSAMYYGRIYNENKNPENLFLVLTKNIDAKDTNGIIKYGNLWFSNNANTREAIITQKDEYLIEGVTSRYTAGQLTENEYRAIIAQACNTDNRLRCSYVRALLESGTEKNLKKARTLFNNTISYTQASNIKLQRPSYLILEFSPETATERQKEKYLQYITDYSLAYGLLETNGELTENQKIIPQFFIEFARAWYDEKFS
jgi:uncharacterized protein (UPF0332 family)